MSDLFPFSPSNRKEPTLVGKIIGTTLCVFILIILLSEWGVFRNEPEKTIITNVENLDNGKTKVTVEFYGQDLTENDIQKFLDKR